MIIDIWILNVSFELSLILIMSQPEDWFNEMSTEAPKLLGTQKFSAFNSMKRKEKIKSKLKHHHQVEKRRKTTSKEEYRILPKQGNVIAISKVIINEEKVKKDNIIIEIFKHDWVAKGITQYSTTLQTECKDCKYKHVDAYGRSMMLNSKHSKSQNPKSKEDIDELIENQPLVSKEVIKSRTSSKKKEKVSLKKKCYDVYKNDRKASTKIIKNSSRKRQRSESMSYSCKKNKNKNDTVKPLFGYDKTYLQRKNGFETIQRNLNKFKDADKYDVELYSLSRTIEISIYQKSFEGNESYNQLIKKLTDSIETLKTKMRDYKEFERYYRTNVINKELFVHIKSKDAIEYDKNKNVDTKFKISLPRANVEDDDSDISQIWIEQPLSVGVDQLHQILPTENDKQLQYKSNIR